MFGETIANPAIYRPDIELFAKLLTNMGSLVVDNTFPTPNCRPIEWGADIVTHPPPNTWMDMVQH